MFELDQAGISRSRQGYVFAYAQIAFNQFRRFVNLEETVRRNANERNELRERTARGENLPGGELVRKGWRTFTLEFEQEAEQLECKILAVVTTAFFLEAFINDYCARRESATFARKYVGKLDPVAKWVVIPRMLAPPGIDPGQEVFERLRRLFRLRNDLVHHMTKEGGELASPPEFPPDMHPANCIQLVVDLLRALLAVDSKEQFGGFVLRHLSSWMKYGARDRRFYPILWEA